MIRKHDRDVDGGWSFREFITSISPLTQYSVKAQELDKVQVDSFVAAVPVFKGDKERPAFSKASKSTAAMSFANRELESNELCNMRNIDSVLDINCANDLSTFPYLCDQQDREELQFADKIKLMSQQQQQPEPEQYRPSQ